MVIKSLFGVLRKSQKHPINYMKAIKYGMEGDAYYAYRCL